MQGSREGEVNAARKSASQTMGGHDQGDLWGGKRPTTENSGAWPTKKKAPGGVEKTTTRLSIKVGERNTKGECLGKTLTGPQGVEKKKEGRENQPLQTAKSTADKILKRNSPKYSLRGYQGGTLTGRMNLGEIKKKFRGTGQPDCPGKHWGKKKKDMTGTLDVQQKKGRVSRKALENLSRETP